MMLPVAAPVICRHHRVALRREYAIGNFGLVDISIVEEFADDVVLCKILLHGVATDYIFCIGIIELEIVHSLVVKFLVGFNTRVDGPVGRVFTIEVGIHRTKYLVVADDERIAIDNISVLVLADFNTSVRVKRVDVVGLQEIVERNGFSIVFQTIVLKILLEVVLNLLIDAGLISNFVRHNVDDAIAADNIGLLDLNAVNFHFRQGAKMNFLLVEEIDVLRLVVDGDRIQHDVVFDESVNHLLLVA